jgi:tRNA/rRNA methyltransferase
MPDSINLENITLVLQKPKYPENIGAAARAACNMGITHLRVIKPEDYDLSKINKLATHEASKVVDQIQVYDQLYDAVAEFNYVVGTTARLGGERQVICSPSQLSEKLVPISRKNRIAILFGPEDRGLTNEDIRFCHILVNIPTSAFSSLNLGHAVMVICYELFSACSGAQNKFVPRLANRHELEGMYEQLKDILVKISYMNPDNSDYWMVKVRRFLNRLNLKSREVSIIRGICRQINWYGEKRFTDGRKSRD